MSLNPVFSSPSPFSFHRDLKDIAEMIQCDCLSLFHATLSALLGKSAEENDALLAEFYSCRARTIRDNLWGNHPIFGENLICPAINSVNVQKECTNETFYRSLIEKRKTLVEKHFAGREIVDAIETNPYAKQMEGICGAISLHFISDYLQRFAELSNPSEKEVEKLFRETAKKWMDGGTSEDWIHNRLFVELNKDNLFRLFFSKYIEENLLPSFYDLTCQRTGIELVVADRSSTEVVAGLKDGAYYIAQKPEEGEPFGHAIVYIKHQNVSFLWDSNHGAVKIPQGKDVKYLYKSMRTLRMAKCSFLRCSFKKNLIIPKFGTVGHFNSLFMRDADLP
jgi:hypothetical protein